MSSGVTHKRSGACGSIDSDAPEKRVKRYSPDAVDAAVDAHIGGWSPARCLREFMISRHTLNDRAHARAAEEIEEEYSANMALTTVEESEMVLTIKRHVEKSLCLTDIQCAALMMQLVQAPHQSLDVRIMKPLKRKLNNAITIWRMQPGNTWRKVSAAALVEILCQP